MEHEVDENGQEIHVDVDPQIPTGICAICSWAPEPVYEEEEIIEEEPVEE